MKLAYALNPDQAHADLADLAQRYRNLPPRRARWKTNVGRVFLDDLEDLILDYDYPIHVIGKAFGTTPQAVSFMRWRARHEFPDQWPDDCELRQFQEAWAMVRARNRLHQQVRPSTEEFRAVHEALWVLHRFYELETIATVTGIRPQVLRRFLESPTG